MASWVISVHGCHHPVDQHVVGRVHQLDVLSYGAVLGFTLRLPDGQPARGPQLARGLQLLLRRHLQRVLGRVVRFRRLRHQQRQPSHSLRTEKRYTLVICTKDNVFCNVYNIKSMQLEYVTSPHKGPSRVEPWNI